MQNSLWNVHTYLYCRKVKCHWNLIVFFLKKIFFPLLSFFPHALMTLLFSCHLQVPPSRLLVCLFVCLFVCFSFRSVYQHRLARRNVLRSSHNSRLEMLGMYGVTWFFFFFLPLKIIHPYKIKVSKKQKERTKKPKKEIDTNQTKRIKSKKKCLCASWYWTGKNVSSSWIKL